MLSIFRSIRRSLINEGKIWKYIKYSVGEILLIMVGILLALQVQTWNENRRLEKDRQELIENLKADFNLNRSNLEESLADASEQLETIRGFAREAIRGDAVISEETKDEFINNTFAGIRYKAFLGTYETAVSDGTLSLLGDRAIYQLFLKFKSEYDFFQTLWNLTLQDHYMGGVPDFWASFGDPRDLSAAEFQEIVKGKKGNVMVNTKYRLKNNRGRRLRELMNITDEILAALEALE